MREPAFLSGASKHLQLLLRACVFVVLLLIAVGSPLLGVDQPGG